MDFYEKGKAIRLCLHRKMLLLNSFFFGPAPKVSITGQADQCWVGD